MSDKLNRFVCLEKGFVIQEKERKWFISLEYFLHRINIILKKTFQLPWKQDHELTTEGNHFQISSTLLKSCLQRVSGTAKLPK